MMRVGCLGEEEHLPELPMRHILQRVELLIGRRHFYPASPTHGSEEIETVWIRDLGTINFQAVVMKTFVQRRRDSSPNTILPFGQGELPEAN